ncbi:hypothetical protein TSOC_008691 [Tetrabaena socialis]|uniref:Uncharacterized protein n=1 Tax=Tetrabaena socialis TaxID=47790 RepID=A0A2J7ZXU8_9CHLO|nr:hypothetical protein TSOC_008691 [Tetrabaena socialis]|eukprot:PNH05085.1 hypothetical protein TSOC_008691 [Tetrabaena socialis]
MPGGAASGVHEHKAGRGRRPRDMGIIWVRVGVGQWRELPPAQQVPTAPEFGGVAPDGKPLANPPR